LPFRKPLFFYGAKARIQIPGRNNPNFHPPFSPNEYNHPYHNKEPPSFEGGSAGRQGEICFFEENGVN